LIVENLMFKRPHYIALALLVVLTLIILNLPSGVAARLKLGIGSLFLPLFGLTTATHQAVQQAGDAMVPRRELVKQNEALKRENEQLRLQALKTEEIARENERLRQLVGWQRQKPWKLKLANVVLREPANWWRSIQIDLGSRDGITNNLPVMTTEGLVGRVNAVSLTRSQVVLLGDPTCKPHARVENESRDTGVVGASGPLDAGFVEMGYLSGTANIKPGQNVVTSGEGGVFPKGLPIGKIVDCRTVEYGLATVARVKLAANLNSLEEVWVLFP
jgi:rod shape-determining protein MreC